MSVLEVAVGAAAPWLGPVIMGVILAFGVLAGWAGARLGRPGQ